MDLQSFSTELFMVPLILQYITPWSRYAILLFFSKAPCHLITNPSYLGEFSHGSLHSSVQKGSWFLILQYIIFHGSSHSSVQNTVEQIQNSPFLQYSTMFMDNLILVHETHNPSHTHGCKIIELKRVHVCFIPSYSTPWRRYIVLFTPPVHLGPSIGFNTPCS